MSSFPGDAVRMPVSGHRRPSDFGIGSPISTQRGPIRRRDDVIVQDDGVLDTFV